MMESYDHNHPGQLCHIIVSELPVSSPLIHGTLGVVSQWQETLREELESRGPPPLNYIPGCAPDPVPIPGRPAIHKYRSLLEKENTPFKYVRSLKFFAQKICSPISFSLLRTYYISLFIQIARVWRQLHQLIGSGVTWSDKNWCRTFLSELYLEKGDRCRRL